MVLVVISVGIVVQKNAMGRNPAMDIGEFFPCIEWPKQLERIKSINHTGISKMVLDGRNIENYVGLVLNLTRNEGNLLRLFSSPCVVDLYISNEIDLNERENFRKTVFFCLDLVHRNADVNVRILDLGRMRSKKIIFTISFFLVPNHLVHVSFENIVVIGKCLIPMQAYLYPLL